jgi:hypothetical protein
VRSSRSDTTTRPFRSSRSPATPLNGSVNVASGFVEGGDGYRLGDGRGGAGTEQREHDTHQRVSGCWNVRG